MRSRFQRVFGSGKPVIAMVHLASLPGTPLYDADAGVEGIIEGARADLDALQAAGVDAVMFGNENDRPYEPRGRRRGDRDHGLCHRPAARRDPRAVRGQRAVGPAGDPGARRGDRRRASCARSSPGTYASDMGMWAPGCRERRALRPAGRGGRRGQLYNVSAEFAHSLDARSLPDRARSAVFSSVPDAVLVSGTITGEAAAMSDLEAVKRGAAQHARARQHRRQARHRGGCPGGRRRASSWARRSRSTATPGARRPGARPRFHGPARAAARAADEQARCYSPLAGSCSRS